MRLSAVIAPLVLGGILASCPSLRPAHAEGQPFLTLDWARTRDRAGSGAPSISGTAFDGVAGEIVYQAMNVYFDPIGLGFLVSPGIGRNSRNVEAKVLLQKNFFNDRLRAVLNVGGEFGTEREAGTWNDVSALTFDAGTAYN